jgi:alanine-synthesizing transaminase
VAPALQNREHLSALNSKLERRRDITVNMLNAIDGVSCVAPKGAFYAFPQLEDIEPNLEERFIAELIEATGVVVVHGGGFGQRPETAHFRCVFLPPEPILEKAYTLVGDFKADWRP